MNKKILMRAAVGLFSAITAIGTGCAVSVPTTSKEKALLRGDDKLADSRGLEGPPIFLQVHRESARQIEPVRLQGLSLSAVMQLVFPNTVVVPLDGAVNLDRQVNISTQRVPEAQFLELLGTLTNYDIQRRNDGLIEIRSWMTREWSLSAYAVNSTVTYGAGGSGAGSGGQGGGGGGGGGQSGNGSQSGQGGGAGGGGGGGGGSNINASFVTNLNEWAAVVETARSILGSTAGIAGESLARYGIGTIDNLGLDLTNPLAVAQSGSAAAAAVAGGQVPLRAPEPQLVAIQSIGLIQASGPVPRIRELDRWLQSLISKSARQFRIDARIIEVTLNDRKSRGIDWTALGRQIAASGAQIGLGVGFSAPALADPAAGSLRINPTIGFGDESLNVVLQFLSRYGTVELRDEPQTVALNGRTAYLGSGTEFGYVSSISQTITQGTAALTPELARILIGLQIAVTPRLMDDGRIMMDVVPLVSSFTGFDNFTIQGNQFSQPRVALKQLATQAVTRSGVPIQLGGLISSRITSELRNLPPVDRSLLGIDQVLDKVVGAESNEIDRRELLILITPYLIES